MDQGVNFWELLLHGTADVHLYYFNHDMSGWFQYPVTQFGMKEPPKTDFNVARGVYESEATGIHKSMKHTKTHPCELCERCNYD